MLSSFLQSLRRKIAARRHIGMIRATGGLPAVTAVKAARLSYLGYNKFARICQTIDQIKKAGVRGDYLEAGCALGGSSIVIGALRPAATGFRIHDVFGMIPPPSAQDTPDVIERYQTILAGKAKGLDGDPYYGYMENLRDVVTANLTRHLTPAQRQHIQLVEGLVQDTLVVDGPVAFAHIDVDWYDPVMVCLQRIVPQLSPAGAIILDDYFDWGGCRKAVDEFLASPAGKTLKVDAGLGSLRLTRIA